MARKRDFDNPVFVTLVPKGGKAVTASVSSYAVTDKWLIVKKTDDSVVTKYVSLDSLVSFFFDEPKGFKAASGLGHPEMEFTGPVSASPERDALVERMKKRVVNPKAVPEAPKLPEVTSEKSMIESAFRGSPVAMMGK